MRSWQARTEYRLIVSQYTYTDKEDVYLINSIATNKESTTYSLLSIVNNSINRYTVILIEWYNNGPAFH